MISPKELEKIRSQISPDIVKAMYVDLTNDEVDELPFKEPQGRFLRVTCEELPPTSNTKQPFAKMVRWNGSSWKQIWYGQSGHNPSTINPRFRTTYHLRFITTENSVPVLEVTIQTDLMDQQSLLVKQESSIST